METKGFFKFEIIINVLALSALSDYLYYGFTANFTLSDSVVIDTKRQI